MAALRSLSIFSLFLIALSFNSARAARFDIINRCNYTIWAAALPGGGRQLNSSESWALDVADKTTGGRIWARTGCNFDGSGRGHCETGDCGGLLECQEYGTPPNTLAEFTLNQYNDMDFYGISLVDGFNVPIEFSPNSTKCKAVNCTADINGQCPDALKAPGGCNSPCTVFQTDEYCCTSGGSCAPTEYSQFFKDRCPDACSYPFDDTTSTFTCPGGTNYTVVFCP